MTSARFQPAQVPTPLRSEVGLPSSGIVFCTFNNTYKLNPAFFDSGPGSCGTFPTASCGSSVIRPPFGVICAQRLQPAALTRHAWPSPRGCRIPSISRDCASPICFSISSVQCGRDCQRCLVVRRPRAAPFAWRPSPRGWPAACSAIGLPELITFDTGEYERRLSSWPRPRPAR